MHQFDEHHSELKGFSEYFHSEMFPLVDMQDSHRREAVGEFKKYGTVIAVITIGFAIYFFLFHGGLQAAFIPCFFGAISLAAYYYYKTDKVKANMKALIVEGICGYIGWNFHVETTDKPDVEILATYGLLPKGYHENMQAGINWNSRKRASFEDQMSGEAHGAQFRSVETHLERENDDSWITVFRGQVMTLTFPQKFLGKTVVLRDKGTFQPKKKGDMKRVGLVDPVFEKIFEAYSTDQVESRYLLDPVFMQKLVDLEASVDGKKIRFGFIDGQLLIVVETSNRFEAGSMLKPLTVPERTQKILDEVGAIYDIVDGVMKPQG